MYTCRFSKSCQFSIYLGVNGCCIDFHICIGLSLIDMIMRFIWFINVFCLRICVSGYYKSILFLVLSDLVSLT